MATDLSQEIAAFDRLLPSIRSSFGSTWAVILDRTLKAAFKDFSEAAKFAVKNFPDADYLIRHTDEERPEIPYLMVEE